MLETSSSQLASSRSNLDHSVSELLDVVWRRKWLVAGCVAISVLLGAVYVYQAEPVYSVQARVLVQPHGWPLDDGAEARREKEFLATQAEIISSPAVIERGLADGQAVIDVRGESGSHADRTGKSDGGSSHRN